MFKDLKYIVCIYSIQDYAKSVLEVKFDDLYSAVKYAEITYNNVPNGSIEVSIILPARVFNKEVNND